MTSQASTPTGKVLHLRNDLTSTACGHWLTSKYGDDWILTEYTTYDSAKVTCEECIDRMARSTSAALQVCPHGYADRRSCEVCTRQGIWDGMDL